MRALVVDDVAANCRVLKALLSQLAAASPLDSIDMASNGRDAVEAFQNAWKSGAPYELICLDVMLPDIDGLKALEVIRKMEEAMNVDKAQRAHVILITSLETDEIRAKAGALGCDGYLVKPFYRKNLNECLKKAGLIE